MTEVRRLQNAVAALGAALEAAEQEGRAAAEDLAAMLEDSRSRLAGAVPTAPVRAPSAQAAGREREAAQAEADILQFAARVSELERAADEHLQAVRGGLGAAGARVEALRATLPARRQALRDELDSLEQGVRDQVRCFLDASAARTAELETRTVQLAASAPERKAPRDESPEPDVEPLRDALRDLEVFAAEEAAALTRLVEGLVATMKDVARVEDSFTRSLRTA